MKPVLAALTLIAAVALCIWSIFGDIPQDTPTPPQPDLSWIARAFIGFAVIVVVSSIGIIIINAGRTNDNPDYNMDYATLLDVEITDIHKELVRRPSQDRAEYLNRKLAKLEEQKERFWKTHKYEDPVKGGRIVEK